MNILCLDWETFFCSKTYTLKKMTTTAYVRDPRFKAHGAAVYTSRMKQARWMTGRRLLNFLANRDWSNTALLGHHTHFDGLILTHHFGFKPAMYLDTLSMGRALYRDKLETRSNLDALSQAIGIGKKHETYLDNVDGVRSPSRKDLRILGDGAEIDCALTWQLYHYMLEEEEFPEEELQLISHTVRCYTEPMLQVDKKIAKREHNRVVKQRRNTFKRIWNGTGRFTEERLQETASLLRSRTKFPKLLQAEGVEPPLKISPSWVKKPRAWREENPEKKFTYAFAKNDISFLALQDHENERVRDLVTAKLLANSSIYATRPLRMIEHADPALTIYLNMYGGHTLRWSGGDGMNPQNLGKDGELRLAIIPPKGYSLVIVDSGQIEARKNAWLAGQWSLIEQFIAYDAGDKSADPYCIQAESIFGRKITKADTLERFVGKTCILGMGFQMSATKYQLQLESGALGQRVTLPNGMYEKAVKAYRDSNPHIVKQWWYFNDVIPKMMRTHYSEQYRDCIEFAHEAVWLPSGLGLHYPRLRVARPEELGYEEEQRAERFGNDRDQYIFKNATKLYGGKLDENIVQALARQVVAEQILRIADMYRVVMMVHDEVVLCVPNRLAKRALRDTVESFKTPPDWCSDLPTMGEGGIYEHYVKM